MASSSSIPQKKYDVFISFRGEDTRDNFTSHLYSALCRKKIHTFIDNQLNRGDEISPSLLNAIEGSNISVVIFSEGYASSRWCLDELVNILECKNKYGQMVIPVFYRVDPSDVRNQTGNFGDLFSKLEERFQERLDKLQTWRIALREAANLSGFDSHDIRSESELIVEIANNVLKRLKDTSESYDEYHLIGAESSIKKIESLLSTELIDVYTLGIWGIGGIGKTTISRAIFSKIYSNFEGCCFIENVREEGKNKGLDHLRQQLFSTIFEDENVKIGIPNNDLNFRRLSRMKVLIVFDDVTRLEQIEFFIQNLRNLAKGSRIIITSRDKHVLKNCRADEIYQVKELLPNDALKLFSQHAFRQNHPNLGYEELSDMIKEYASGVPLALKVLGCFLFQREKDDWESAVEKLKRIPNKDIQKVLKISYDGLDEEEQTIFLDIVCLFKGMNKEFTIEFLDACGFSAKIGIRVLVDKCLIAISNNIIIMHDLLQEMGREIVRQESTNDPGRRSRLWHHEDISKVLRYNTGTEAIQGICFDMSEVEEIRLNPSTLTKMRKLRLLKFYGENKCKLSNFRGPALSEVRYLRWDGYPLKSLTSHIHPENLVALELCESKVEKLWDGVQNIVSLKRIDLGYSRQLTKLPDLSRALNLETLSLNGCSSLVETHSSIQHLNKLVTLSLIGCESLKRLPLSIHSERLNYLFLWGCTNLKRLPEISSCNLQELFLDGTAIEELPSSLGCPSRQVTLNLQNCSWPKQLPRRTSLKQLPAERIAIKEEPSSILCLQSLKYLSLGDCRFKEFPESLCQLSSLIGLFLDKNSFERIPESIINLCQLERLSLRNCDRLRYLPKLPRSLWELTASDCTSLEASSGLSNLLATLPSSLSGQKFDLKNCYKLDGNELRKIVEDARENMKRSLIKFPKNYQVYDCHGLSGYCGFHGSEIPEWFHGLFGYIRYPGSEIPEWFKFQSTGSSLTLERPQFWLKNNKIVGVAFCAMVAFEDDHHRCDRNFPLNFPLKCEWKVKTKDGQRDLEVFEFTESIDYVDSDHVSLIFRGAAPADQYQVLLHGFDDEDHYNNEIFIQFSSFYKDMVKGCGIHFFYEQESKKDSSRSFSIDEEEEPHPKRLKYASTSF